jgi:hypothetical protein
MAYSNFTLAQIKDLFNLTLTENQNLFHKIAEISVSDSLQLLLKDYIPLATAISTEKARSEFLIAPILAEVKRLTNYQISLFSGTEFNVEPSQGLHGFCDFIICASTEQYFITAPILAVVEAKNENIISGLGQCVAEMVAVKLFNERNNQAINKVYGVVTTGTNWRFLVLENNQLMIDSEEYYIKEINKILGILVGFIQNLS